MDARRTDGHGQKKRKGLSLLYYRYRFECLTRSLFLYPKYLVFGRQILSVSSTTGNENRGFALYLLDELRNQRGGFAAIRLAAATEAAVIMAAWNLIASLLQIHSFNIWIAGSIISTIVSLLVSFKADRPKNFLSTFTRRELASDTRLFKSTFLTASIIFLIWAIFVVSMIAYLSWSRNS